jgi:glycosyltransferase involved in cell wall biosynthesis
LSREQLPPAAQGDPAARLHICIVYDRLYPWSIGGAERWYRGLAELLAKEGHKVTYLTTRQWPVGEEPNVPGVRVVGIAEDDALYTQGHRRVFPVLRFGLALGWHLVLHGRHFDAVHTSAMSSWSALAAGSLAYVWRYRLVLDWWEVWTWAYWWRYLGLIAGTVGWVMQRQIAKLPHEPLAHSALHATRLRSLKGRHAVRVSRGSLPPAPVVDTPRRAEPLVVYAGRFIPEKQVPALVQALAQACARLPTLRAVLIGEGPDRLAARDMLRSTQLESRVSLPGFIGEEALADTLGRALCLVLLSRREGYGLVVVEAAALGVPSVVLHHPDSAASELIVEGVNGFTCASTDPGEVASAILRVHDAGDALRHTTLAWFRANAGTLTIEGSLPRILSAYRGMFMGERTEA